MGPLDTDLTRPTFPAVLRRHAATDGERTALSFEGRTTSYAALGHRCSYLAGALASDGAGRGCRIGYLGKNSDRFFELLIAAAMAGAVLVPIGWRLAAPEVAAILDDSGCTHLFADRTGADLYDEARPLLARPPTLVRIEDESDWEPTLDGMIDGAISHDWHAEAEDDAPFLMLYTSGTTGLPKGVVLSQRAFFAMRRAPGARPTPRWDEWDTGDIALVAMPIAHIGGIGLGMLSIWNGTTAVIASEFRADEVLGFIERDGVNRIFLVPAALRIMLEDPRARSVDYSRMRSIVYGASPIPVDLLREAVEVFGCGFVQTYGMTETMGTIVSLGEEDHDMVATPRMRSAGRPMEGVELQILGQDATPVPPGEIGEIVVRSAATMSGYWKRPEDTAKTLAADGWLRTGDAGYLDADGYLYIRDRVKEMIISGGENVYPAEVENAIFGHAAVRDVAVIGLPDARWGEAVTAIIVCDRPEPGTEADILEWTRKRIAAFKVPKRVHFVGELPRNASGKILKRELRNQFAPTPAH